MWICWQDTSVFVVNSSHSPHVPTIQLVCILSPHAVCLHLHMSVPHIEIGDTAIRMWWQGHGLPCTLIHALTMDSVHRLHLRCEGKEKQGWCSLITVWKRAVLCIPLYGRSLVLVPIFRWENVTYPHRKMECFPRADNLRRKTVSQAGMSQPSNPAGSTVPITCSSSAALGVGGRHSSFTWSRPDFTSSRGSHWKEEEGVRPTQLLISTISIPTPTSLADSTYLINKLGV